ncbi:MAG: ATP-binding protein [Isosphaeraceae bacterium]
MNDESAEDEERILLLALTKKDADAAGKLFATAGLVPCVCRDLAELCAEMKKGAAVAVLPDEAILKDDEGRLRRQLDEQPPWSDFPLIVLTPTTQIQAAAFQLESVGHMTLVRRPIEIHALASLIRASVRDRRRQYDMRAALAEQAEQARALREADRQKDEFLAMLAHELRNPLAAVNNAVRVLRLSPDEPKREWAGGVVERQVRQLVRLIDDLLDVSRISSGKIRLRRELVDTRTVVENAVESVRPLVEARGHALTVAVERVELPLFADTTRVEQIVLNLLTNAAKYTEDGGLIQISARREDHEAVIVVRDNGMGIPPEKLPEMFRLFAQGDRSLARSEGGLGIGLTIVQKLAEMHGGRIEAHSDGPGRGSTFTVRLPLALKPDSAPTDDRPRPTSTGKGTRILVVDDNADTAAAMVQLLSMLGNHVISADNGPEALDSAHAFHPDLILLDIGLPGMDGYQVAQALRKDASLDQTVIIAVSGYGQEDDRRRSQAAGFDHHLVKPVDFDQLLSLIGRPA